MARILLVEDDKSFARIAQLALKAEGYDVEVRHDISSGKQAIASNSFDLVLSDLRLPDGEGVEILREVIEKHEDPPPVLIMTAFATVETAVSAMKDGASDYLTKPFSNDELIMAVQKALHMRKLENENRTLREALASTARFENIIGNSAPIQSMFDLIRKTAPRDVNVLIRGESGTGKELVARALHFASPRADGPFVPIDSAAIPDNLLESELFGHVKGAFTGAVRDKMGKLRSADGGTVFLDEIGDMNPDLQAKLLRVLQERVFTPVGSEKNIDVDIRVIAATHVDLEIAISEGNFREDLFFRLNVITINVPALRERKDDIPLLVKYFISQDEERSGIKISRETSKILQDYNWPGNVRELKNTIEHALVVADSGEIQPEDLPERIVKPGKKASSGFELPADGIELDQVEKQLIIQALERSGGNQTNAAKLLGISRPTLIYRLEKYDISRD